MRAGILIGDECRALDGVAAQLSHLYLGGTCVDERLLFDGA